MNDILYAGKHLRTYSVQKHAHMQWELIYCTGGNGELLFEDGSILPYTEGEVAAVPPGLMHSNFSTCGFTNLHIRLSDATILYKNAFKFTDDTEKHVLNAFNSIFYFFNSQIDKKELVLSALGDLVASYTIAFRTQNTVSRVVEEIKSDIVKNFPNPSYELDTFIRSLPFSYDYLRKLFKSEMGVTPHTYLTAMRMETAKKLLSGMSESEYNISEISMMCGYDEPLYFSRVFKKEFGVSPFNYAKSISNE